MIRRLLARLSGTRLLIINDAGTRGSIDARVLKDIAEIEPMTAGCIGCEDLGAFTALIERIKSRAIDWLIVEPIGIAEGDGIKRALAAAAVEHEFIALVSIAHFEQNARLGIMPAQLAVADLIALTWWKHLGDGQEAAQTAEVEKALSFIGRYTPGHRPIVFVDKEGELPAEIAAHGTVEHAPHEHNGHHCCDGDDHNHQHDGHHDSHDDHHHVHHRIFTRTAPLKPAATLKRVEHTLASISGLIRAKGVAEGRLFHWVHGTFAVQAGDGGEAYLTVYGNEPISDVALREVAAIEGVFTFAGKSARELMRAAEMPLVETLTGIADLCTQVRELGPVNSLGELVTHPEPVAALMQLIRRRGVPPETLGEAVRINVRHWLACAQLLAERFGNPARAAHNGRLGQPSALLLIRDQDLPDRQILMSAHPAWQRDLGTSLGWHAIHHAGDLAAEMPAILEVNPASLLFTGLTALDRVNSDPARAKQQVEEAREIGDWGIRIGLIDSEIVRMTLAHCLAIAQRQGETAAASLWEEAAAVMP